jgi:peptide/nickel transport system substrate-binding protein
VKKGKPDANLYQWVDGNWNHLRPSMEYAPFKDFRVRKALFLAIDYKGLGDGNYGDGWAYQASLCPGYPEAWLPDKVKALPGFNPETKAADRAESAKLLTAAGFPNGKGLDFDIIYQGPNDQWAGNATRFQGQMQEVYPDMKVTLHPFPDSASFSVPQAAGNFKMVSYDITVAPDAVIEFTSQYHSLGSRNYGHFKDPDLDQLMDKAGVELKYDARAQLLETAQQKFISDWLPMFVLYAIPQRYMVQGNVGGFDTTAGLWFQSYAATTKVCRWFYMDK